MGLFSRFVLKNVVSGCVERSAKIRETLSKDKSKEKTEEAEDLIASLWFDLSDYSYQSEGASLSLPLRTALKDEVESLSLALMQKGWWNDADDVLTFFSQISIKPERDVFCVCGLPFSPAWQAEARKLVLEEKSLPYLDTFEVLLYGEETESAAFIEGVFAADPLWKDPAFYADQCSVFFSGSPFECFAESLQDKTREMRLVETLKEKASELFLDPEKGSPLWQRLSRMNGAGLGYKDARDALNVWTVKMMADPRFDGQDDIDVFAALVRASDEIFRLVNLTDEIQDPRDLIQVRETLLAKQAKGLPQMVVDADRSFVRYFFSARLDEAGMEPMDFYGLAWRHEDSCDKERHIMMARQDKGFSCASLEVVDMTAQSKEWKNASFFADLFAPRGQKRTASLKSLFDETYEKLPEFPEAFKGRIKGARLAQSRPRKGLY